MLAANRSVRDMGFQPMQAFSVFQAALRIHKFKPAIAGDFRTMGEARTEENALRFGLVVPTQHANWGLESLRMGWKPMSQMHCCALCKHPSQQTWVTTGIRM
jgi:hypothetical protein